MSGLRVFTFSPDWGLPTTGPFALKLLAWLGLNDVAYEQVIENRAEKGPLGKSPWIELDGQRIGDSDVIIRHLAHRFGKPVEEGEDAIARATAHAWKTAFEERFHQVLEWELFVHPEGVAYVDRVVREHMPPFVAPLVSASVRRHFRRQLHARGIARHEPGTIAAMGKADLDALAACLDGRAFLAGPRPVLADLAVFGQVAPLLHWPMETPVAMHAKQMAPVRTWSEQIKGLCFSRAGHEAAPTGKAASAGASA